MWRADSNRMVPFSLLATAGRRLRWARIALLILMAVPWSASAQVDLEPPTIEILDPAPGSVLPDATARIQGTARDEGFDRVEVVPAGGAAVVATWSNGRWHADVPLAEGFTEVVATAFDAAGNQAEDSVVIERRADVPRIVLDAPAAASFMSAASIAVSGTVDPAAGAISALTVGGQPATLDGNAFSLASVPLTEGQNRIVVRATDDQGRQSTATRIVVRDTGAPTLAEATPPDGALAIDPATAFRVRFDEPLAPVAPSDVSFEVDGVAAAFTLVHSASGDTLVVTPQAPLPSGAEIVLGLGTGLADVAGNGFGAIALSFTAIDAESPSPPTLDAVVSPFCASSLTVGGSAEPGAEIEIAGGAATVVAVAADDGRWSAQVVPLEDATRARTVSQLAAVAIDSARNRSAAATLDLILDCTPPRVVGATVASDVTIAFSEPMDPATMTPSITVSADDTTLAGTVTMTAGDAGDDAAAVFTPDVPLPGGTLTVRVSTAAADPAGNALAAPFVDRSGGGAASFFSGTVIDQATGRPLEGARVLVTATDGQPTAGPEQSTGPDGRFLVDVAVGTHDITIARDGYAPVFRVATTASADGVDLFDPRLTPLDASESAGPDGIRIDLAADAVLDLPAGALAGSTTVSAAVLSEQGLSARLPYGWSPVAAAWVDVGESPLAVAADLTLPLDAAIGTEVVVAALDLATLECVVKDVLVTTSTSLDIAVDRTSAWVVAVADTGTFAPPAAVPGALLGGAAAPAGDEVSGAAIAFDPSQVFANQTSRATVTYSLDSPVPSGAPLSLEIEEILHLLDGSERRESPFRADLVLYHASSGAPQSRFDLRPSEAARMLPIDTGDESVSVRRYDGVAATGAVIGPDGGTVTGELGDQLEIPAGGVTESTAVTLARQPASALPLGTPRGTVLMGAVDVGLGVDGLAVPATLRYAAEAPPADALGLLLHVDELDFAPTYRVVSTLVPTAGGWRTADDHLGLPWPGLRTGGQYALVRFTQDFGHAHGGALDAEGSVLVDGVITSPAVDWIQRTDAAGRYVLPLPLGDATLRVTDTRNGDFVLSSVSLGAAGEMVEVDPRVEARSLRVVDTTPADGATGVLVGIEPSVRFSALVDEATLDGALVLLDSEGTPVASDFTVQADRAIVVPRASLAPDRVYRLIVGAGIRSLDGRGLSLPRQVSFTTEAFDLPDDVEPDRVFAVAPDAAGLATIQGVAGAVPSGTLVFVENLSAFTTTESVTAAQDGSFSVQIAASLDDRLFIHVIMPGANEVLMLPGPWMRADLRAGLFRGDAVRFATVDGVAFDVPEDTFASSTWIEALPAPIADSPLPAPDGFRALYAARIGFGGLLPRRAMTLELPVPASADATADPLLAKTIEVFGGEHWMIFDRLTAIGDRLTNAPQTTGDCETNPALPCTIGVAAPGYYQVHEPLVEMSLVQVPRVSQDLVFYIDDASGPAPQALRADDPRATGAQAFGTQGFGAKFFGVGVASYVASFAAQNDLLVGRRVPLFLATRITVDYELVANDVTSGYEVFRQVMTAPSAEIEPLSPSELADFSELGSPTVVAGSPVRFFVVEARGFDHTMRLAPGIEVTEAPGGGDRTLTVDLDLGAAGAQVDVRFYGLDDPAQVNQATDGAGQLTMSSPVEPDHRYLLVVGARLAPSEAIELTFDRPMVTEDAGFDLEGLSIERLGVTEPHRWEAESRGETVRLRPTGGWIAGETYTLRLSPGLRDAAGNAFAIGGAGALTIDLEVPSTDPLGSLDTTGQVWDVAVVGNLLFAAANRAGLEVLDVRNPAALDRYMPEGLSIELPLREPVTGVAADIHGRVVLVGGGHNNYGLLATVDPLAIDPVAIADARAANPDSHAWREGIVTGATILSDPTIAGPGDGAVPDWSTLPGSRPVKVDVLTNDVRTDWRIGDSPEGAGFTVTPSEAPTDWDAETFTISGGNGKPYQPVTVRNLSRGTWNRTSADASGSYSVTIEAGKGERLELVRNIDAFAYVAMDAAGGEIVFETGVYVVDLNAVWKEHAESGDVEIAEGELAPTVTAITERYARLDVNLSGQPCGSLPRTDEFSPLDLAVLIDDAPGAPQPWMLPAADFLWGLDLLRIDPTTGRDLSRIAGVCGVKRDGMGGSVADPRIGDLALLTDYPFDFDGDGRFEDDEYRDYILLVHLEGQVLIVDATDRAAPSLVGQIDLPGSLIGLSVDRERRRLFVTAGTEGVHVVDFDALPTEVLDTDGDGQDDRLLESIDFAGDPMKTLPFFIPELGLIYTGGLTQGVASAAIAEPRVRFVALADDGTPFEVDRIAPFGVPTAPAWEGDDAPDQPGLVRLEAWLPAELADGTGEIRLEVHGVSPEGEALDDPLEGISGERPRRSFDGANELVLRQQSTRIADGAVSLFLSDPIVVLADLRASSHVGMTSLEREDEELCTRCDLVDEEVYTAPLPSARLPELLSGHGVGVRFPDNLRLRMETIYGPTLTERAEITAPSVPWDLSPARLQEPTLRPPFAQGAAAPGTLLHSGEMVVGTTDLAIRGRGFDVAFVRTHRSQTLGGGPFGRGWDHGYRTRLRALPNGNVELFDGRGRRETFAEKDDELEAPAGRFQTLEKRIDGFTLTDPSRNRQRFDRHGRLIAIEDAVKTSDETGNAARFAYDDRGRLVLITDTLDREIALRYDDRGRIEEIEDFSGRVFTYGYDAEGRLERFETPAVDTLPGGGASTASSTPLITRYTYHAATGSDLASRLRTGDRIATCTDPKGQDWLSLTYTDVDGDNFADEVTGQAWGGDALSIAYGSVGASATVTDRRGNPFDYTFDARWHTASYAEPVEGGGTATWSWVYDEDGLMTSQTEPLGRTTIWTYQGGSERRAAANLTEVSVTADGRGANGSDTTLTNTYSYHEDTNQPVAVTDARGAVTSIDREDGTGLVRRIDRPEGATTSFDYNDFGQVTQITNPNDHITTFDYFADGSSRGYLEKRIVAPGDPGLTTTFETDDRGNVTKVTDPRGVEHTTDWNDLDWPTVTTAAATGAGDAPALGYVTRRFYDANGNQARIERPLDDGGSHTFERFAYDDLDAVLTIEREIGGGEIALTTFERDENRNITKVIDAESNEVTHTYGPRNLATTRTSNLGAQQLGDPIVETFAYDAERQLTSMLDGRGKDWSTEYDGFGRMKKAADPLGNAQHQAYDNASQVTCAMATGADGGLLAATTTRRDLLGRTTHVRRHLWRYDQADPTAECPTAPIGKDDFGAFAGTTQLVTRQVWDPASNRIESYDALDRLTKMTYDDAERMVSMTDPADNEQTYERDGNGNVTRFVSKETTPVGGTVEREMTATFDALDRPIEQKDGFGNPTQTTYDARNLLRVQIDAAGYPTVFDYDGLNRRIAEHRPAGVSVYTTWDKASRQVGYGDAASNQTTWTYDAANRRIGQVLPGGDSWQYVYDAASNLTQLTDANGTVVEHTYDDANRLLRRDITLGQGVIGPVEEAYTYDGLDRATQATMGNVTTDLVYDSLSRQLSETTLGRTVGYSYDAVSNRTGMTYPSGHQIVIQVDELNRAKTIREGHINGPVLVDYGYQGPFLRASATYRNGLESTSAHDVAWRPTKTTVQGPSAPAPAFEESLAWSPRGLKTAIGRGDQNGRGYVVAHDGAQRITQAAIVPGADQIGNNAVPQVPSLPSRSVDYAHDATQNLVALGSAKAGDRQTTAVPNDASGRNRPGSRDGDALAYDQNGNRRDDKAKKLAFDFRNRLTEVRDASNTLIATYTYDAMNRRVRKEVVGQPVEETVYSGWREIERYTDGVIDQRYTHGAKLDEIVRFEVDTDGNGLMETAWTPLYDDTGNLVKLTDGGGDVVARYDYTPFGEEIVATSDLTDLEPVQVTVAPLGEIDIAFDAEMRVDTSRVSIEDLSPPPAQSQSLPDAKSVPLERSVSHRIDDGPLAGRRVAIALDPAPVEGTPIRLTLPADAAVDRFGNPMTEDLVLDLTWPAVADGTQVLLDTETPEVERLRFENGHIELTFSEPPAAGAASAITVSEVVPSQSLATKTSLAIGFTLAEDGHTLRSDTPVPGGTYEVRVDDTTAVDLAGKSMDLPFDRTVLVDPGTIQVSYDRPDDTAVGIAAFANRFGFHGRPIDLETGYIYFRNRYYDPKTGRFVSADPLGYVDGPSMYQGFGSNPLSFADPLGLYIGPTDKDEIEAEQKANLEAASAQRKAVERKTKIAQLKRRIAWLKYEIALREHLLSWEPGSIHQRAELLRVLGRHGHSLSDAAAIANRIQRPGRLYDRQAQVASYVASHTAGIVELSETAVDRAMIIMDLAGAAGLARAGFKQLLKNRLKSKADDVARNFDNYGGEFVDDAIRMVDQPLDDSSTALLHYYSPETMGRTRIGHFSVETRGRQTLHTEQLNGGDWTTMDYVPGGVTPDFSVPVRLPMTSAAQAEQIRRVGASLGPYCPRNNSCLTNAADVLRAGGADIPSSNVALRKWVRQRVD